nr:ankyrin repeat and SAM domain-containing protein 6 isoform X1 [Hydra vulgaris]
MNIDQNLVKSLLNASERGDLAKTELCLKSVAVDSIDDQSHTALHFAAANGHETILRELIKKGAGLECRNWCGWTPIMFAAYYGHYNVVSILLQNNADVNIPNSRLATPLTCAARCGQIAIIELLLQNGAKVNQTDNPDVTPLMAAAQHGHTSIVSLLLQYSADIDYKNPHTGYTALMLAACNGHLDVVRLLIEKGGANVNLRNILNQNAYKLSILRRKFDVEKYLSVRTQAIEQMLPIVRPSSTLIDVVKSGKLELVQKMLNSGHKIDVNEVDSDGATPLIYSSMNGHYDIVLLLLKAGAKTDIQDQLHGWTALMQATLKQHVHIVKLLIQHGADVNVKDFKGFLAFDLATLVGVPEITRLLVPNVPGVERPSLEQNRDDKSNKTSWMSKFSDKLGIKQRAPQPFSRVPVQPNDIVSGSIVGNDTMGVEEDNNDNKDELKKTSSVLSVLDAAIALKGTAKARFTLVSPQVKLPDDVVAPVVAPYSKLPSFDLPKMPIMKLSYDMSNLTEVNTVSDTPLYNGSTNRSLNRPQVSNNSLLVSPFLNYNSESPQSSLTSSNFTSVSQNNGPSKMTNFKKLPPIGIDYLQKANSNPSWNNQIYDQSPFTLNKNSDIFSLSTISSSINAAHAANAAHKKDFHYLAGTQFNAAQPVSELDNTTNDINMLLKQLSLEKYRSTFEREEVDMEALNEMDDGDLKLIGIDQTINRDRILQAVQKKKIKSPHNYQMYDSKGTMNGIYQIGR